MTDLGNIAGNTGPPPLLSIRPSPDRVRAIRRRTAPVVGVVAAGGLLRGLAFSNHVQGAGLWTALLVLVGGGLLVGQLLVSHRLRTLRLLVTEQSVGMTTMLGATQLWPRASIDRLLSVTVIYSGSGVPAPQWLFLDANDNRLMVLNPRVWQPADLEALTKMLGVAVEDMGQPVKAGELRRRLPRAVPWWQAHTALLGGLAAVVVIAVLVPFAR